MSERAAQTLDQRETVELLTRCWMTHDGMWYRRQNRLTEAEALMRRALGIWERTLGPKHRDLAPRLERLADLYSARYQSNQAERRHRRLQRCLEAQFCSLAPRSGLRLTADQSVHHGHCLGPPA